MKKIYGNSFEILKNEKYRNFFNGIITDIPYHFKYLDKLVNLVNFITKKDSFFISFCNMKMLIDLVNIFSKNNFKFKTFQIWNKEPLRTWIYWSYPLRTCEFIVYLNKGNFKFSFKNGNIKKPYKRSSFGGKLKNTSKNTNKVSFGMYSEIITFKNNKNKIHKTEKPIEFSDMFSLIVGKEKIVLDLFAGSFNLLQSFKNSIGIDLIDYNKNIKKEIEKKLIINGKI